MSYIFNNKTDLINYLYLKLNSPTEVKIQKTLYFLFAIYGSSYGQTNDETSNDCDITHYPKYLFEPYFTATTYGPLDKEVHNNTKKQLYKPKNLDLSKLSQKLSVEDKQNIKLFINTIIEEVKNVDDFTLIDRTLQDTCVQNAQKSVTKIINPKKIIKNYLQ